MLRLLTGQPDIAPVNESYVGAHLVPVGGEVEAGEYYEHGERAEDPSYFFARDYMPVLRPLLHELVLRGFDNQLRHMGFDPVPKWVLIKEPNGSHAADTIVSLLPRSRMLFLLRDGRDVVDSLIDAMLGSQSWWAERTRQLGRPPQERLAFVVPALGALGSPHDGQPARVRVPPRRAAHCWFATRTSSATRRPSCAGSSTGWASS